MKDRKLGLVKFSTNHPKLIMSSIIFVTVILILLAALPGIAPAKFKFLNPIKIDTDPENMLAKDEPIRVFHDRMKKKFNIYDIVVVGVVNEKNPNGVFNKESLKNIYELTEYAKTLRWKNVKNPEKIDGVVEVDLIAPSTVDNIEQGGLGSVRFEWLMPSPPETQEEALQIRKKAERIPFLKGTLISEDGKAIALYLPLTTKKVSYKVYASLKKKIATLKGEDKYYITGLPVAEDTFGVEMFRQMGISGPITMIVIFLMLLIFFRQLILITAPMILAMISVIWVMSLLIITGNTIHIMSSMIPVFIMPIAVLNAIHILSEFFDRYQKYKDKKVTILNVLDTLFIPILYTSATTVAGFASLALAPIPPVQTFGLFVAFGVFSSWLLSITFIPSYIMFIPEKKLENFGAKAIGEGDKEIAKLIEEKKFKKKPKFGMDYILGKMGDISYHHSKELLIITLILLGIAIYGIKKIRINDNPVRWFTKSHPIRVADTVLNRHFGGTYMAYLNLSSEKKEVSGREFYLEFIKGLDKFAQKEKIEKGKPLNYIKKEAMAIGEKVKNKKEFLNEIENKIYEKFESVPEEEIETWDKFLTFISAERQKDQIFKQPEVLTYIDNFEKYLLKNKNVGKINSLNEIVKTVHRELYLGNEKYYSIPETSSAVAQCLITYQNSHRPQDLWHFTTPDYKEGNLWIQLHSGDNIDVKNVVETTDKYFKEHPAPYGIKPKWFGLTYINIIWQKKMVGGMMKAFLGSYFVVLLMMIILFRSSLWSILSMIPLTLTLLFIYGIIGLIGKDYDMPVAVLSPMTLGLAIDFAIHFLTRTRRFYGTHRSWLKSYEYVFGEPARAILRNIIVISSGFLPLLAAPLVPYKTVGIFMASILFLAGLATFFILSSLINLLEQHMFPEKFHCCFFSNSPACVLSSIAIVLTTIVSIQSFSIGSKVLFSISIATIFVLAFSCLGISKRFKCETEFLTEKEGENE